MSVTMLRYNGGHIMKFLLIALMLLTGCSAKTSVPPAPQVVETPKTIVTPEVTIEPTEVPKATETPKVTETPSPEPTIKVKSDVTGKLKIHFIDVGQADSILIQLPNNENMLIDAGNNADASLVKSYISGQGIKKIDYLVGTHPHEDHIGGLDVVIDFFDIGKIYMPKVTHTTKTFEDVLVAIKNKGLKVTTAASGVNLINHSNLQVNMVAPNGSSYKGLNDYSSVIHVKYGNAAFLFTGDAEAISEGEMLKAGHNIKADVLKVGHHGSKTSTTSAFLKAVSPKYAVISAGAGNKYGHPSPKLLKNQPIFL